MYSSHVWNLFYLHWQKIVFFVLISHLLQAQNAQYRPKFMEGYDDKPIHYGFLFGLPITRYNLTHSEQFNSASDSVLLIKTPISKGFRMGFVLNMYLNENWDFRTTPTVSLYEKSIEYVSAKSTKREVRESTWIEIPLLFKYKSERRMNSRMYLLGGITLGFETNVRKSQPGSGRLSTSSYDVSVDYGIGFEQFLPYTKLSPEIRFSHGLINVYQQPDFPITQGIRRLTTHTIGLYIMFE